ncbi:MAG: hypothetical protein QOG97_404 [Acidimicrobiaceae bacterium]|nr:hypothetical protein [Acidimicrobiaceae bacterium]
MRRAMRRATERWPVVPRAVGWLISSRLPSLVSLNGTDKGSNGYVPFYERHFKELRRRRLTILEIGIYKGAGLRVWRSYFPSSSIVGIDINPSMIDEPRITCRCGSQDDPAFLAALCEEFGPFDIVIDDGSHVGRHVIASFDSLFPHVVPGGWYVIEDIATAYWEEYEGGPVGMEGTAVAMVKDLVDTVFRGSVREGTLPAADLDELHVYRPALVFMRKSCHQ